MKTASKLLAGIALPVAAVAIGFAAFNASVAQQRDPGRTPIAPYATPEGLMIQPLGTAQGYSLNKSTATRLPRERIAFANDKGMTLYVYDKDAPGVSNCTAACAKTWVPAAAAADAKPVEGWSIIARADGTRQWAYKEKPLYTYSADTEVGGVAGNKPSRFGRGELIGPRGRTSPSIPKDTPIPEGWKVAMMYPVANVALPSAFVVREVEDAMALVIVDDFTGKSIYAFEGDPKAAEKACTSADCRRMWQPVVAPRIASGKGEFGTMLRNDGINQWTYKGRALYTYYDDAAYGDAFGANADNRFEIAAVARYWTPATVKTVRTQKMGIVLATESGQTLYRRSAYIYQSGGGHSLRRGDPIRPAVGRDLGADARCQRDCDKWKPFLAPASAKSWGDWSTVTRPDGSKQWTQRGFALWTFDGDKVPGDLNGNDDTDLIVSEDAETIVDIGTPYYGAHLLFWIAAYP
jgi:predicted lipoprotein with Yx(FWY)xxD motif